METRHQQHEDLLWRQQSHQQLKMAEEDPFGSSMVRVYLFVHKLHSQSKE